MFVSSKIALFEFLFCKVYYVSGLKVSYNDIIYTVEEFFYQ